MPKRVDVIQTADEDRYFAILNAYPLRGDMELLGDQKVLAYWLAGIVENQSLVRTIYHKPRSPSIVIVGISKEFTDLRKLLGLHSWSKFRQQPAPEEIGRTSRVYFCTLGTDLQLQKHGWKRIEVEDAWFEQSQWSLVNHVINYPYPKTQYCAVPNDAAALIELELCRPLPVTHFPEAPTAPVVVPEVVPTVGSAAYYQSRTADASQAGTSKSARKRNKKKSSSPAEDPKSPSPEPINDVDAALVRPPTEDWFMTYAKQLKIQPDLSLGPPPGIPMPSWATEMDHQDMARTSSAYTPEPEVDDLAAAMEAYELGEDVEYDSPYVSTYTDTIGPDDSASVAGRAGRDGAPQTDDADVPATEAPEDDGWGGAPIYTYDEEKPANWRRPGQPLDCPEHGIRCGKGICKHISGKKAQERRRKEEAERVAERKKLFEQRQARDQRKNGTGPHDQPPHLSKADDDIGDSVSMRGGSNSEAEEDIADGDGVSEAPSRPFTDVSYGGHSAAPSAQTAGGQTSGRSNRPTPASVASGWSNVDSRFSYGPPKAAPSAVSYAQSYAPSFAARSAVPSAAASGWSGVSEGGAAAFGNQGQPNRGAPSAVSYAPSSAARSAARSAAPSAAPSAARSGWSGVSEGGAAAFANQGLGTWGTKPQDSAWGGSAVSAVSTSSGPTPAELRNGGRDDDVRSNVTVGRSSVGQAKDPWDVGSAGSITTATTNAGWGPPKPTTGAPRGRGRGGGNAWAGAGRRGGQPARGRGAARGKA